MVFSSITFLFYFLPALIILYAIVPKKLKNLVMILGSFVFYSWGEIRFIPILVTLSVIDYTNGRLIEKFEGKRNLQKLFMILSVVINAGTFCFFKYTNFLVANFCTVFGITGFETNIMLPIGISFNAFQEMSYIIDVYRKRTKAEKNYYNYLTFTTLFPQIVAGPIVRYTTVGNDLDEHNITFVNLSSGLRRFIRGLAKKVLIANNIGAFWDSVVSGSAGEMSVVLYWLGIIAYTFQIFFDFSGYSDMAIGLAKIFGFTFDENFDYPYISKSVTEFWRRWHMTLGKWFRDYVYIPMGGNRVSVWKNIFNILVVWALTGFWHGASWNFVLWGLYYALILLLEKFVFKDVLEKIPSFFRHFYTMFFVVIGWALFYFDSSILDCFSYIKGMFGFSGVPFINSNTLYYMLSELLLFAISAFCSVPLLKKVIDKAEKSENICINILTVIVYFAIFALCVAYLVDATYNPFLYFRF